LSTGELTLERLASYPILTYSFGFTGRSNIEAALNNTGMELDVILSAADTDVIKTYVRLGMGVGIIAGMAYAPEADNDLVMRDLSHLIPRSRTKIAYLKNNYLPLYAQHFIDELLVAAKELGVTNSKLSD
jgi:LysR family cys regulon transcriptional activator